MSEEGTESDTASVITITLAIAAGTIAAWWLTVKAPRIMAARRAELRSPPRGTVRRVRSFKDVYKTCPRCKRQYTQAQWKKLHFVGYQNSEWGKVQELRNCGCGSTIAVVVIEGEPEEADSR
jgi:hypothetical protein